MLDGDQLTLLVRGIEELSGRGYSMLKDPEEGDLQPTMGLTLVGDFAQLRPVNAPFAFESAEWGRTVENDGDRFAEATRKLDDIRRQSDAEFIQALRAARLGQGRLVADYIAAHGGFQPTTDDTFDGPTILAKNESVDKYNWIRLDKVTGRSVIFPSARWGEQRAEWGNPNKPPHTWGIPPRLNLKIGALVMVLANRRCEGPPPQPYLYVNGELGTVVDANPDARTAIVQLQRTGQPTEVLYVRREKLIPCDRARRAELRAEGKEELISEDGRWEITGWVEYLPLRVAYGSTVHKCCAGDTRVLVEGRGSVAVRDLRAGDWIDTGCGPARVMAIGQSLRKVVRLTTARGYRVTCSTGHRWKTPKTSDGFTVTAQLRRGDVVLLTRPAAISGTQEIDRETACWIGATLGDGNWSDRREGQIHFTSSTSELRDRWMRAASKLGGRPNTRRDLQGCHLTNLPLRLRAAAWGCDYVTSAHKRIPEAIWHSGPVAWGACLQGLFDTDGSAGSGRIVYATRSRGMADDLALLLLYLGIPSTTGEYRGRTGLYWHVRISAEGRHRFVAKVGASHPAKARALAAWRPNRELKPFNGTDRVARCVISDEVAPMFDVELQSIHELGWGPIVGSNSQGLTLDKVQVSLRDHFFKEPGMVYVALSRARTATGLRVVGTPASLIERCVSNPRLKEYL